MYFHFYSAFPWVKNIIFHESHKPAVGNTKVSLKYTLHIPENSRKEQWFKHIINTHIKGNKLLLIIVLVLVLYSIST